MTTKSDFTEEEWARVVRAPFVAGLAISLADPGGPIEAVKETAATLRTVTGGAGSGRGALVDAITARRRLATALRDLRDAVAALGANVSTGASASDEDGR